jgi:hypothetical protein
MTCVGDAVRLSRRDRAAMTLALCELRGSSLSSAIGALQHTDGGAVPYLSPILTNAQAVMDDAIQSAPLSPGWYRAHYRNSDLIRARLALLLRAILRADAGDYGPCGAWRCVACLSTRQTLNADSVPWFFVCDDCGARGGEWLAPPRWAALWASAPTRAR